VTLRPPGVAGAISRARPFSLPLFTNVVEVVFSEVQMHDPA
jgi:hypothetical protein